MRLNYLGISLRCAMLAASILAASDRVSGSDRSISCHGDQSACKTVIAGERELTAMMISGDVGIVKRLFADDAVWSLGSGTRWTKGEAIAALRQTPRMASSQLLEADVRQYGAIAIVLWKES